MSGAQVSNSLCQEVSVDRGTTNTKGPYSWCWWNRYDRKEMVWMVFPRPISSARITLLHLKEEQMHFKQHPCHNSYKKKNKESNGLTCTRSEPTSSSHPTGSLSTASCRLLWMMVVSSEQQTSASASTPTITEEILGSTIGVNAVYWRNHQLLTRSMLLPCSLWRGQF